MPDALDAVPEIRRGLLSDQIYDLLKQMIKGGTLAPGEQLVESGLAKKLQVSQAPVREALKRLTHDGLVSHVRHQGSFVATYSDEEIEQARVARAELETLAGRLTAGRLTAQTREHLSGLIAQMHDAAQARELGRFRELDFTFHRAVIEASRNVYLPRMWDIIEPSLRSLHLLGDPDFVGDWTMVAEWHDELLAVLDAGDPDAAAALFRAHAAGTLRDMIAGAPDPEN